MTVAFVIQTFKDLDQIERLARTITRGTPERLIVVSHRGTDLDRRRLEASGVIDRVLASPGGRGRFGVIDGLISSMRWLEKQSRSYEWLLVLSGQDYPVRPLADLEAELAASEYDGYFHHFDAMDEASALAPPMRWPRSEVVDRYFFRYALLREQTSTLERALLKLPRLALERSRGLRLHTSFGLMLGVRPAQVPFSKDFKLYGGSYWLTINRKAVRAVLDFVDERPDIVEYFRNVIVPEEVFLQTVLANDRSLRLTSHEQRYMEFDQKHGHPREFVMADLQRVFASGCFFARKFNLRQAPEVLDAIDRHLEAETQQPKDQPSKPLSAEASLSRAS
ncbi:MAG: beta-1,6-N-acetylglucosaminyltransferase [Hyphomicrobiaceae bacterium]